MSHRSLIILLINIYTLFLTKYLKMFIDKCTFLTYVVCVAFNSHHLLKHCFGKFQRCTKGEQIVKLLPIYPSPICIVITFYQTVSPILPQPALFFEVS